MPKVPLYNQAGDVVGEFSLSDRLFGVQKPNPALVHQVVVSLQANARKVVAHTKTRGEVRGGGKKPWKQKHTGRARHGSIRSPIWKGGGVVFGPRNDRSYEKKIPKTMKRAALAAVLSDKVHGNALVALDALTLSEPKTKVMAGLLRAFAAKVALPGKKQLIMVEKNPHVVRAARNIPSVHVVGAEHLNILDVMNHSTILATRDALQKLEKIHARS